MTEQRIVWKKGEDHYEGQHHAFNKKDEFLGSLVLSRVGGHMHWCWQDQPSDIIISPGCHKEIGDKMKELFKNRKMGFKVLME
jgi:hypothetical protein